MLVSVIITTCNRAHILPRAIKSVLNQTYHDLECIIVDDASTDNTEEVIRSYKDDRIIYIKHDYNKHSSAARNTGFKASSGDYIAFLDDDDEWLPKKLEKQMRSLKKLDKSFGMVYCWMRYYDNGRMVSEKKPELNGYIFKYAIERQPIGNVSTYLIKRPVFDKIGLFDEKLRRGIDGDFARRVSLYYKIGVVPEILVKYYLDDENRITRNDKEGLLNEIYAQKDKINKFGRIMKKYPKEYSNLNVKIGLDYVLLGKFLSAYKYFYRSFLIYPLNKNLYIMLFKSLMIFILKKDFKNG